MDGEGIAVIPSAVAIPQGDAVASLRYRVSEVEIVAEEGLAGLHIHHNGASLVCHRYRVEIVLQGVILRDQPAISRFQAIARDPSDPAVVAVFLFVEYRLPPRLRGEGIVHCQQLGGGFGLQLQNGKAAGRAVLRQEGKGRAVHGGPALEGDVIPHLGRGDRRVDRCTAGRRIFLICPRAVADVSGIASGLAVVEDHRADL